MMTRSIVGRFLILAVLLVSLGVIAQAALIITRGTSKAVAKASTDQSAMPVAVAASTAAPPATPPADAAPSQTASDPAPVRVVYPGPLGDTPIQAHKSAGAAPTTPAAPAPAPVTTPVAPPPPPPPVEAAAVPPPAQPVVVASADADTQAAAAPAPAGKGGIDLNSASVDVLNHLGGGHIGQSIVKHRPYSSVEDLVKKRVVRRSVYDHIKDQVAAQQ